MLDTRRSVFAEVGSPTIAIAVTPESDSPLVAVAGSVSVTVAPWSISETVRR